MRIARNFWDSILHGVAVNRASKASNSGLDAHVDGPREPVGAPLEGLAESPANHPVVPLLGEFIRQGDYWTIRYQGQTGILKATRGLDCLCYLLRHPGRDVHVSELLATRIDLPTPASLGILREPGDTVTAGLQEAGPILDSRAKAEYKRRIDELRKDIEEAKRFNDFYRVARIRGEIDAIAERLAVAVGLGGRDRRAWSEAERARSAVTKRSKDAIKRIAVVIPALGGHLAARIKTGYFCSYNPRPDRPVSWKF